MSRFEEIYPEVMPIVAGGMVGYDITHKDWLGATVYSIIAAMFLGEKILEKLKKNNKNLEGKV